MRVGLRRLWAKKNQPLEPFLSGKKRLPGVKYSPALWCLARAITSPSVSVFGLALAPGTGDDGEPRLLAT